MVSPGNLRAVRELQDGPDDAFTPSVDENGVVTYPSVERHLTEQDDEAVEVLDVMADRGLLDAEFTQKVYVCPNCAVEGMQYSTGCPDCGSIHSTQESVCVHRHCDESLGPAKQAEHPAETESTSQDDRGDSTTESHDDQQTELYCSTCEETVSPDETDTDRRYLCHDCDAWFETPTDRLWCRECLYVYSPGDTHEAVLYRYPLTEAGNRWLTEQLDGRHSLAATLEDRGYETQIEATVSTAEGTRLIHLLAEDDLFDDRIVAGVHASPTVDDVERLEAAANAADARPIVLLTEGSVSDRVAETLTTTGVTIVRATDDGLFRERDIHAGASEPNGLLDWVGSRVPSVVADR
ncbi:hypothetical protein OB905_05620 [Halobacteria archaeon AArc-dxtr1]|nr:hypothetical protein [Halobacteria archaeon AArc-dxtr1]